jgi:hypothetical protein
MKFTELQAHRWYTVISNDILSGYAVWLIEPPLIHSDGFGLVKFYAFSISNETVHDKLLTEENIQVWYHQNFTDINDKFICEIVYEPETDMLDHVSV